LQEHRAGWLRTRAIILDTGNLNAKHEVLLAPSHGLPAQPGAITHDCVVETGAGTTGQIADVWLPDDRDQAGAGDWAVLVTRTRFRDDIRRLETGRVSASTYSQLIEDEMPITLLMHSQDSDQSQCRILNVGPREHLQTDSGVFLHSCRTWPGVSGAPIVADIDGRLVVIGFSTGRLIRPHNYDGPLYLGIGRFIDERIEAAIQSAIVRANP